MHSRTWAEISHLWYHAQLSVLGEGICFAGLPSKNGSLETDLANPTAYSEMGELVRIYESCLGTDGKHNPFCLLYVRGLMEQPLWDTGKGAEHGAVITE